jgi:hypothetical protein
MARRLSEDDFERVSAVLKGCERWCETLPLSVVLKLRQDKKTRRL